MRSEFAKRWRSRDTCCFAYPGIWCVAAFNFDQAHVHGDYGVLLKAMAVSGPAEKHLRGDKILDGGVMENRRERKPGKDSEWWLPASVYFGRKAVSDLRTLLPHLGKQISFVVYLSEAAPSSGGKANHARQVLL
jgi:hypothetical protein